ncbi:MAG TPA: hypothetical protein VE863_09420, partial [Pyrinomonadaceae bacterium]|nr:hypothetical protein [Pyrinomonadaceae bacterium]
AFLVKAGAQTQNQSYKVVATESFEFPNQCTNELMSVSDTTYVSCHDQLRADGKFTDKCEIRQVVTAVGESSGTVWQGEATFKDEFVTVDPCNFTFSNVGTVHLISRGPAVNTMITFNDFVRMQDCVMTDNQHVQDFDCHGR